MSSKVGSIKNAWETTKWLFTQLFSSTPDPSVSSGVKMLQWVSKGLLIVGALSSVSYTAPTFYNIWSGIMALFVAQIATIICVVLILFLIELSFGALTPFALDFTFSGQASQNDMSKIGATLLWIFVIFLGGASVVFTYNGASTPVHASIVAPEMIDISSVEAQKQFALSKEEHRYDALVDKYHKEDSAGIASLSLYHHNNIKNIEAYAIKKYGEYSHLVDESVSKARKDSTIKVQDYESTKLKAPYYVRERNQAINDARKTWNGLIEEKKAANEKLEKLHNFKVSAAIMLIQNFGAGSTILFFILQVIISTLRVGETSVKKKW